MPSYYLRVHTTKADIRMIVELLADNDALSEQSIRDILNDLTLIAIGEAKQ